MSDESIFAAALGKAPGAERRAFLDGACGGDHDLRRRIERMLEADGQAGGILECAPDDGATDALGPDAPTLLPERVFAGRFKLRQKLGEGGMGEVWVADQAEPVQRRVAIKVIRPGLDSERMLARFEQERQALALMDHPNIAKVLDAGEADGRPYFVMELIKGVPITDYCDRARLSPRERHHHAAGCPDWRPIPHAPGAHRRCAGPEVQRGRLPPGRRRRYGSFQGLGCRDRTRGGVHDAQPRLRR